MINVIVGVFKYIENSVSVEGELIIIKIHNVLVFENLYEAHDCVNRLKREGYYSFIPADFQGKITLSELILVG